MAVQADRGGDRFVTEPAGDLGRWAHLRRVRYWRRCASDVIHHSPPDRPVLPPGGADPRGAASEVGGLGAVHPAGRAPGPGDQAGTVNVALCRLLSRLEQFAPGDAGPPQAPASPASATTPPPG